MQPLRDHVIIAGFGVGGRFIAECLKPKGIPFVLVEKNADTCATQKALGTSVIEGDISDADILRKAGIETAMILALAIPDERAALRAVQIANEIREDIHIIASTRYTSTGLEALEAGADDVIVAEQAVAQEFYRRIAAFVGARPAGAAGKPLVLSDA